MIAHFHLVILNVYIFNYILYKYLIPISLFGSIDYLHSSRFIAGFLKVCNVSRYQNCRLAHFSKKDGFRSNIDRLHVRLNGVGLESMQSVQYR
jgi:hypothetical protein